MTEQTQRFDLIVIGGGPGGYVAAARAAQHGLRVACLEKDERLGGVCLNRGCIPSKALLDSSHHFERARQGLAEHGVGLGRVKLDLAAMLARKEKVVAELTENVRRLLERHKVQLMRGTARLTGAGRVTLRAPDGSERELTAGAIVLATGSEPAAPPQLACDGKRLVTSSEALNFAQVPRRLGIVGAGYIGLELGTVWRRLGSQVTLIEMLPRIAPSLEGQSARTLERLLRTQGLDIRLKTRVTAAQVSGKEVRVELESQGQTQQIAVDRLLVCVGRRPLTSELNLEAVGVQSDAASGRILVNAKLQTSVPGIYAIGDLVAGPMLAHKASAEGTAVADWLAGRYGAVNYEVIPAVAYTWPEAAGVGLTSEALKERGIAHRSGTYPFGGNGRARCLGETDGFVKVLADAKTDRVLGVHILGPQASELIAACGVAMELGASSEDIARTIFSHPTLAESLMEAAGLAGG